MDESKIGGYRAQAEACLANAELTEDIASKGSWIQLAQAWTQMADNMSRPGPEKTDKTLD
jgi:hypothetical protein